MFSAVTSYLRDGGRVSDGCHNFIDKVHRDVAHHPRSLVFLIRKGL